MGKKFIVDYAAANQGRHPHINPAVLEQWMYGNLKAVPFTDCLLVKRRFGKAQGRAAYYAALVQQKTFENWALNHFVGVTLSHGKDSLSWTSTAA